MLGYKSGLRKKITNTLPFSRNAGYSIFKKCNCKLTNNRYMSMKKTGMFPVRIFIAPRFPSFYSRYFPQAQLILQISHFQNIKPSFPFFLSFFFHYTTMIRWHKYIGKSMVCVFIGFFAREICIFSLIKSLYRTHFVLYILRISFNNLII